MCMYVHLPLSHVKKTSIKLKGPPRVRAGVKHSAGWGRGPTAGGREKGSSEAGGRAAEEWRCRGATKRPCLPHAARPPTAPKHPRQHQVHVVSRYAPLPFGRRSAPTAKPISLSGSAWSEGWNQPHMQGLFPQVDNYLHA